MSARTGLTRTGLAGALAGLPVSWLLQLPTWCATGLIVLAALVASAHVVVTQVIRLRASTDPKNALRVLEIDRRQDINSSGRSARFRQTT